MSIDMSEVRERAMDFYVKPDGQLLVQLKESNEVMQVLVERSYNSLFLDTPYGLNKVPVHELSSASHVYCSGITPLKGEQLIRWLVQSELEARGEGAVTVYEQDSMTPNEPDAHCPPTTIRIRPYDGSRYRTSEDAAHAFWAHIQLVARAMGMNPGIETFIKSPKKTRKHLRDPRFGDGPESWWVCFEAGPYSWAVQSTLSGVADIQTLYTVSTQGPWGFCETYWGFDLLFCDDPR